MSWRFYVAELAIFGGIGGGLSVIYPDYIGWFLIIAGVVALFVAILWPRNTTGLDKEKSQVVVRQFSWSEIPTGIQIAIYMFVVYLFAAIMYALSIIEKMVDK